MAESCHALLLVSRNACAVAHLVTNNMLEIIKIVQILETDDIPRDLFPGLSRSPRSSRPPRGPSRSSRSSRPSGSSTSSMPDNFRRTVIQFLPWKLIPFDYIERIISPKLVSPPKTPRHPKKRNQRTQTDLLNSRGEKLRKINYTKTVPIITPGG